MDVPDKQSASTPPVIPYASPTPPPGPLSGPFPGSAPALTLEHLAQLAEARKLGAGLHRAVTVGKVDGWTTGTFGIITLIFSVGSGMGSISGIALGAGMAIVAFYQLRAADALRRLDEKAPAALARNQVILGILLVAYGAFSLWQASVNPATLSSSMSGMDPETKEMLAPYDQLARSLAIAVYTGVIAAGIIGPGLTAAYYYAQRKRVAACLLATPQWILELQRTGVRI